MFSDGVPREVEVGFSTSLDSCGRWPRRDSPCLFMGFEGFGAGPFYADGATIVGPTLDDTPQGRGAAALRAVESAPTGQGSQAGPLDWTITCSRGEGEFDAVVGLSSGMVPVGTSKLGTAEPRDDPNAIQVEGGMLERQAVRPDR